MAIDSYEKFCNAFTRDPSDPECRQAELLLFLQDWMVAAADWVAAESRDYGLDRLTGQIASRPAGITQSRDVVSRLIDGTDTAVRRITENMRSTLIRENVCQPVYKVREIDSYGLSWLSRRPGRTIKEKISNSKSSMMAVRRRQSVDTGENRLFFAFLREMADLIDRKTALLPPDRVRPKEAEFASKALAILRDPDFSEIRRWENLPPNNTLLSDQNYRKIWQSWNEMKELDQIVREDSEALGLRLANLFFLFLLSEGKDFFALPQVPVLLDYRSREIRLCAQFFYGVDASGRPVEISLRNSSLTLVCQEKKFVMNFDDGNFVLTGPDDTARIFSIEADRLMEYARMIVEELGCSRMLCNSQAGLVEPVKCKEAVVDLFQVRPRYAADEDELQELKGRLLFQKHSYRLEDNDKPTVFSLPCDRTCALEMTNDIETHSIVSAVEDTRSDQLADLMRLLGEYIQAKRLTFLFPDVYNEFQISTVRKALRLAFPKVVSFPRSMGAALYLMQSPCFPDTFTCGDFLLVLDLSYDDLSFTLVQSSYDEGLARDIPEFGGLIWERHPTYSESLANEIQEMTDGLLKRGCQEAGLLYKLLGIQGLASESEKLSILFDSEHSFSLVADSTFAGYRIPIAKQVERYLNQYKQIVGDARVHIVSLSNVLFYKGTESFRTISYDDAIQGYRFFRELQCRTEHMLWKEHLPELAIKLLHGKFNLIEDQTVQPSFKEKKIPIERRFTLKKGKKEYKFTLVSNDLNRKTRYAAVVRNPAFPLTKDVVCRLDMTYQYGSEDPYRLVFIPESTEAGFTEAKVSWEPAGEEPYMDLPFPGPLKPLSWKELSAFNGRYGEENLIDGNQGVIWYFRQIAEKYETVDFRKYQHLVRDVPIKKCFYLDLSDHGRPVTVEFPKNKVDLDAPCVVSFRLVEDTTSSNLPRYRIDLRKGSRNGKIWFLDKTNRYFCKREMMIDGEKKTVSFFQNMFDLREAEFFSESIYDISFSINTQQESDRRGYRAEMIHNESMGAYEPARRLIATHICNGEVLSTIYSGGAGFLLNNVFGAGNSALQADAPPKLTAAFESAREPWFRIYHRCADENIKGRLLSLMSLCAVDLGKPYYIIAEERINELIADPDLPLQDNIGYALGDCSSAEQRSLLEKIALLEKSKPLRGIRLLSKAVWGNQDFILNVDKALLLYYFEIAVQALKRNCGEQKFGYKHKVKISACLEYILAVYRLRSLGDRNLNYYLSRNNPIIQELYDTLEVLVDAVIDGNLMICSYLRLDIPDKGIYQNVPDLLYALLMYVTGDDSAGDIRIAGLSLDDIEI